MTCPPNKISWADAGFTTNVEPFASRQHDHCCDPSTAPQTDAELQGMSWWTPDDIGGAL